MPVQDALVDRPGEQRGGDRHPPPGGADGQPALLQQDGDVAVEVRAREQQASPMSRHPPAGIGLAGVISINLDTDDGGN